MHAKLQLINPNFSTLRLNQAENINQKKREKRKGCLPKQAKTKLDQQRTSSDVVKVCILRQTKIQSIVKTKGLEACWRSSGSSRSSG
jgi:hypothetical protein